MNTKIDNLLNKYDIYEEKRKEINRYHSNLVEDAKTLDINDFAYIEYEELKELNSKIQYLLPKELRLEVLALIDNKKKEKYPQLLKATYFPVLNELVGVEGLTQDELNAVDKLLRKYSGKSNRIKTYRFRTNYFYRVLRTDEKINAIIDFLLEKNIFKKEYEFMCHCDYSDECSYTYVSEDEMKRHMAVWEFEEKIKDLKPIEQIKVDGYEKFEEETEQDIGFISIGCFNGGDYEITSLKDLKEATYDIIYNFNELADLTYERI